MQTAEIIKTLEDIADVGIVNYKQTNAVRKAIALLKEQEPKEAKRGSVCGFACFVCGNCGVAITEGDRYCRHCGRKVLWK